MGFFTPPQRGATRCVAPVSGEEASRPTEQPKKSLRNKCRASPADRGQGARANHGTRKLPTQIKLFYNWANECTPYEPSQTGNKAHLDHQEIRSTKKLTNRGCR